MNNLLKILTILIIILIEFSSISIIMYYDEYKKRFKIKNRKIIYIIGNISKSVICILLFLSLINNIEKYRESIKYQENFSSEILEIESKIKDEISYYTEMKNKSIINESKPYIPDGFEHLEGSVENGFVIEDENKNQYVWVPCDESNILNKYNFVADPFVSYTECYDVNYKEFLNSAFENGGFYISRFEIGKQNNIPVSKSGVEFWNIVDLNEANQIIKLMKNNNYKIEVINSFAYDTTLNWIINNNHNIEINKNEEKSRITGKNKYQNIYDIFDNNYELTVERSYSNTYIYRGFMDKGFLDNHSTIKEYLGTEKFDNRWIAQDGDKIENLGIRTILYK